MQDEVDAVAEDAIPGLQRTLYVRPRVVLEDLRVVVLMLKRRKSRLMKAILNSRLGW